MIFFLKTSRCPRKSIKPHCGFIALMSVIIISATLLAIIVSANVIGFYGRVNVLDFEFKEQSAALAEACVNYAILKLAQDDSYAGDEIRPVGSDECKIYPIGPNKIIETQGVYRNSYTNLRVTVDAADLHVVGWEEIATLP